MRLLLRVMLAAAALAATAVADGLVNMSTAGIEALIQRRLPQHATSFQFTLVNVSTSTSRDNDSYTVSSTDDGTIMVQGNTLSALTSGYVDRGADLPRHATNIFSSAIAYIATSQMSSMSISGGTSGAA